MSSADGAGPPAMGVCAVRFTVGRITRGDVTALCAALADLLRARPGSATVICDIGPAAPDMVTVEALARLRSTARRYGRRLLVTGAGPDLLALITLVGLDVVLLPAGGQVEEGEQPGGVEEVVDGGDPAG